MYATLIGKVEIAFWEIFIDVISRSQYTRSILKAILKIKRSDKVKTYLGLICLAGFLGLMLGFVVPQFILFFN